MVARALLRLVVVARALLWCFIAIAMAFLRLTCWFVGCYGGC